MNAFMLVVQVLTALPALIKAAEEAFGMIKGKGAMKKETVMNAVNAGLVIAAATGNDDAMKPEVRAVVGDLASKATDGIVATYNAANAWAGLPKEPGGER